MAIAQVGATQYSNVTTGNLSWTIPATAQPGDLCVLTICAEQASTTPRTYSFSAGTWNTLVAPFYPTGMPLQFQAFWTRIDGIGLSAGTTVTGTVSANDEYSSSLILLRGANNSGTPFTSITTNTSASSGTPASDLKSSIDATSWVLYAVCSAYGTTWSISSPYTELADGRSSNTANNISHAVAYATGSTSVASTSYTPGTTDIWCEFTCVVTYSGAAADVGAADSTAITDTPTVSVGASSGPQSVSVSDSATIADTLPAYYTDNLFVDEAVALSVQAASGGAPTVSASDAAAIGESVAAAVSVAQALATDAATIGETPSVTVLAAGVISVLASDAAAIGETVGAARSTAQVVATDSATVADAPTVSVGTLAALQISVSDSATITEAPAVGSATVNWNVASGNGFTDVSPKQLVRTRANVLYTVAGTCDTYPDFSANGLTQTVQVHKANSTGVPSGFTRKDSANEPAASTVVAAALDSSDNIRIVWTARSSLNLTRYLRYAVFDTSTDTWGSVTTIASDLDYDDIGQGDQAVALALDADDVCHVVYLGTAGSGTMDNRRVYYRNNSGGSWSSATQVDSGVTYGSSTKAWHPNIVVDSTGRRWVLWGRGTFNLAGDTTLYSRVYSGGSWGSTVQASVESTLETGIDQSTSLLITPDGRWHIAAILHSATHSQKYIRYSYSDDQGASWTANNPSNQATHNPSLGWTGSKVRIYGHGTPDTGNHGDNLYYMEGDGGAGAWGAWTEIVHYQYYDCSINTRWAVFNYFYPHTVDIAYWSDVAPNTLFVGTQILSVDVHASASDAATIGESATVSVAAAGQVQASASDAATIGETVAAQVSTAQAVASDAATVGETPTVSIAAAGVVQTSATDAAVIGEVVALNAVAFAAASDAAGTGEATALVVRTTAAATDAASAGESVAVAALAYASAADALTVGEVTGAQVSAPAVLATDAASVGETVTVMVEIVGVRSISTSDGLSMAEAVALQVSVARANAADAATLGEVAAVVVQVNATATDALTVAEAVGAAVEVGRALAVESLTAGEAVTVQVVGAGVRLVDVTDALTVSEAVAIAPPAVLVQAADALTVTDAPEVLGITALYISVSETVTVTDVSNILFVIVGLIDVAVSAQRRWQATVSDAPVWEMAPQDAATAHVATGDRSRTHGSESV